MAIEKVKVTKALCDGCESVQLIEMVIEEPILGYHGSVGHHYETGGNSATWYACSDKCIGDAVVNALDKARRQP